MTKEERERLWSGIKDFVMHMCGFDDPDFTFRAFVFVCWGFAGIGVFFGMVGHWADPVQGDNWPWWWIAAGWATFYVAALMFVGVLAVLNRMVLRVRPDQRRLRKQQNIEAMRERIAVLEREAATDSSFGRAARG